MDNYKANQRAYRKTLTFRERYLSRHENPLLFLLFSWKFHFYGKVIKGYYELLTTRGK